MILVNLQMYSFDVDMGENFFIYELDWFEYGNDMLFFEMGILYLFKQKNDCKCLSGII